MKNGKRKNEGKRKGKENEAIKRKGMKEERKERKKTVMSDSCELVLLRKLLSSIENICFLQKCKFKRRNCVRSIVKFPRYLSSK